MHQTLPPSPSNFCTRSAHTVWVQPLFALYFSSQHSSHHSFVANGTIHKCKIYQRNMYNSSSKRKHTQNHTRNQLIMLVVTIFWILCASSSCFHRIKLQVNVLQYTKVNSTITHTNPNTTHLYQSITHSIYSLTSVDIQPSWSRSHLQKSVSPTIMNSN